jgi:hypothetical protein
MFVNILIFNQIKYLTLGLNNILYFCYKGLKKSKNDLKDMTIIVFILKSIDEQI